MKKMLLKGVVIIAAVLFVTGCMSSKRMMRISPLSEEINDELSSTNRTNTWPIYYHDNGMHSLLWPFIDWDQNGFAFRPIYNQEGSDKSVVWPLSGWNSKKKEGWVGTGYWDGDTHGVFPLYRHNPGRFSHYGPWWKDGNEHGVPLVYLKNPNGFSHYGPWWKDNDAYGLFPLFGNLDGAYHVLNFYYDNGEYCLFPFFFKDDDEFLIPFLYNQKWSKNRRNYSVLMDILFSYEKNNYKTEAHLLPFWFHQGQSFDFSVN